MNEEIFDSYLKGTMSRDERTKFEEKLKTDQTLHKEFKRYIYLVDSLKKAARKDNNEFGHAFKKITKEQLQSITQPHRDGTNDEKYPKRKPISIKSISTYTLSIAATFILCFWGFSSHYNKLQNDNDLYSSNFNALSGDYLDTESRGGEMPNEKDSVTLEQAKQFYVDNDYEKALHKLDGLKNKRPVMQATCLLKLNRTDEAIKLLVEEYKNSQDGEAGWYLALAYIKKHDKASAIRMLKDVENMGIGISDKAKKLRIELEEK
nr:hypothetical protein [uncultured Bacteroides sp.]